MIQKQLIAFIISVLSGLGLGLSATYDNAPPPPSSDSVVSDVLLLDKFEPDTTIEFIEPTIILETIHISKVEIIETLEESEFLLQEVFEQKIAADNVYFGLLDLGYDIDHPATVMALANKQHIEEIYAYYKEINKQLQIARNWELRFIKYPEASYIWTYMKALGWSNEVCAGIMGNIMVECGGHSFELKPYIYSPQGAFYGICQWHYDYYPLVQGADLEAQCNFLRDTIQKEFNMFGYITYEEFLNLTDPQEVALCFAKTYERCGEGSYSARQDCAEEAYDYFTD